MVGGGTAMRDYGELLRRWVEVDRFRGYLTEAEKEARAPAINRYDAQRDAIVHDLLDRTPDPSDALATMRAEIDAERPGTPDELMGVVDQVEAELAARIEALGGRKPWQRRLIRRAPLLVLAVILAAYGGIRVYSSRSVDAPLETRAGIEQRAAAFRKAVRYADWTDTRRRRWVLEVLLWPIAPNDGETRAAAEFAGVVLDGRRALAAGRLACGAPPPGADVTDADIALIGRVAAAALAPATRWATPPIMTLLPPIREAYPCR